VVVLCRQWYENHVHLEECLTIRIPLHHFEGSDRRQQRCGGPMMPHGASMPRGILFRRCLARSAKSTLEIRWRSPGRGRSSTKSVESCPVLYQPVHHHHRCIHVLGPPASPAAQCELRLCVIVWQYMKGALMLCVCARFDVSFCALYYGTVLVRNYR